LLRVREYGFREFAAVLPLPASRRDELFSQLAVFNREIQLSEVAVAMVFHEGLVALTDAGLDLESFKFSGEALALFEPTLMMRAHFCHPHPCRRSVPLTSKYLPVSLENTGPIDWTDKLPELSGRARMKLP
jgi:hypothetical protein